MISEKLKRLLGVADFYGRDVTFRENGGQSFTSVFGSLVSILISIVTALYASRKLVILIERGDTNVTQYLSTNDLEAKEYGFEDTRLIFALGLAHNFETAAK